jgi:hypothetical protein
MAIKGMENLAKKIGPVVERIAELIGYVKDFFWMLDIGIAPLDALKYALAAAFGPDMAAAVMDVITQVQEFVATVQEAVAPILAMSWDSKRVPASSIERRWPESTLSKIG